MGEKKTDPGKILRFGEHKRKKKNQKMGGWVYVFETRSMPGTVKIDATARGPDEWLHEANACKWHLPDYALVCAAQVDDPVDAERRIHAVLVDRRVDPRRAFFRASVAEARALVALVTARPRRVLPRLPRVPSGTPEGKLRAWVDANYTRIPLREKRTGTRLVVLYSAYAAHSPPVHIRLLGKTMFGKMLNAVYPNVGPYRDADGVSWVYLFRV